MDVIYTLDVMNLVFKGVFKSKDIQQNVYFSMKSSSLFKETIYLQQMYSKQYQ